MGCIKKFFFFLPTNSVPLYYNLALDISTSSRPYLRVEFPLLESGGERGQKTSKTLK